MQMLKTILLKWELKEAVPRGLKARTGMVYLMEVLAARQPHPWLADKVSQPRAHCDT